MDNNKKKAAKQKTGDFNKGKNQWWKDNEFIKELDRQYKALGDGTDKGVTVEQLVVSIEKRKTH